MAHQIHIRTPPTNPDDPIATFQSSLTDSISLLQQHNQYLERQKALEISLDQSKEATISALIKNLVERRKEQDAVKKCIEILFKVKSEFEEMKKRVVDKILDDSKVLLVDQATQCDLSVSKLTSVGTSTEKVCESVSTNFTLPSQGIIITARKEIDDNHLCAENHSKTGFAENVKSATVLQRNGSGEEFSEQNNAAGCIKKKDEFRLKTVRFCSDSENPVFPAINDNSNSQKRVPLQTTPINIFNQIIPERVRETALLDVSIADAVVVTSIARGNNSSIRENVLAKVKSSSPGKFSRSDLKKIYKIDTFRSVKRSNSGNKCSSNIAGIASFDRSHQSPAKCASVMEVPKQQVHINRIHEADEMLDDFTPYDIQIPHYPGSRRTVLNEIPITASMGFQKKLSTTTSAKQPKRQTKKKRDKPEEKSHNGKRLIQTKLNFEACPKIDEFSTSTSDVESMIQEEIQLQGDVSVVEVSTLAN